MLILANLISKFTLQLSEVLCVSSVNITSELCKLRLAVRNIHTCGSFGHLSVILRTTVCKLHVAIYVYFTYYTCVCERSGSYGNFEDFNCPVFTEAKTTNSLETTAL